MPPPGCSRAICGPEPAPLASPCPSQREDLKRISPDCDLLFAAFVVPDVLLQAYDATGRKEFFTAAQAFITSAQAIDQSAWLPPGEFWNDHAVAARICVLANFWRLYRHSPDYRPEVGRQVLQMVAHSEQLLAKAWPIYLRHQPRDHAEPRSLACLPGLSLATARGRVSAAGARQAN